ncbi:uncharacterized protein SPSC_03825 [Sporisorium scitamineum]|uniref:Uncharacterized protein n=1 Tax=Sporisorium scitamineum TaxID=49012 RepID=A0A127Z393_9BASI|nr:uncharacterized protein SPSC_03825 [Sporisorium scitamineum]
MHLNHDLDPKAARGERSDAESRQRAHRLSSVAHRRCPPSHVEEHERGRGPPFWRPCWIESPKGENDASSTHKGVKPRSAFIAPPTGHVGRLALFALSDRRRSTLFDASILRTIRTEARMRSRGAGRKVMQFVTDSLRHKSDKVAAVKGSHCERVVGFAARVAWVAGEAESIVAGGGEADAWEGERWMRLSWAVRLIRCLRSLSRAMTGWRRSSSRGGGGWCMRLMGRAG